MRGYELLGTGLSLRDDWIIPETWVIAEEGLREFSITEFTEAPVRVALMHAFQDTGVRFGNLTRQHPSSLPGMKDLFRDLRHLPSKNPFDP